MSDHGAEGAQASDSRSRSSHLSTTSAGSQNPNESKSKDQKVADAADHGATQRVDWFTRLFGFTEKDPLNPTISRHKRVKAFLEVKGSTLHSKGNKKSFAIGTFDNPSVAELMQKCRKDLWPAGIKGMPTVDCIVGDITKILADKAKTHSTFQVASQFNCLEFVNPDVVPEDGITMYEMDRTQGPACSITCGAATAYRNYFVSVKNADGVMQEGQTAETQINNLADLMAELNRRFRKKNSHDLEMSMLGGYTLPKDLTEMAKFINELTDPECIELYQHLRVGVHSDVQVTSADWGKTLIEDGHTVTQVFCSACAIGYSQLPINDWMPISFLVLSASYEATLYAALANYIEKVNKYGSNSEELKGADTVYLTLVGGGVFGNPPNWIVKAIDEACKRVLQDTNMKVTIVEYAQVSPSVQRFLENSRISPYFVPK